MSEGPASQFDPARGEMLASVVAAVLEYAYVWEYQPDGSSRALAQSRPWHEFLDIDPGPDALACWQAAVHPEDHDAGVDVLAAQRARRDGERAYRVIRRDGTVRWLLERWRCRPGRDGAVLVDGLVTDVTAMREAEAGLTESRSLLAAVIDAVDAYVYCCDYDPDGRARPRFESIPTHDFLRVPAEVDAAEAWRCATHPDDRAIEADGVQRRRAGVDGSVEHRVMDGTGAVRWLRHAWRCVEFRDGTRRSYGIVTDVTEAQTAREAAVATRATLDAVLGAIDDYVYAWAYRPDGTVEVTFESVDSRRFLGAGDDVDGAVDVWRSGVHPDDLEAFDRLIEDQQHGRDANAEYRIRLAGGPWRWLYDRSRGRRLEDGTILAEGIVSDVTAVREAQERLRERDAVFRTLAEALPLSIWSEDARGSVEFVNRQALDLWALDAAGFGTHARNRRIHPDDRAQVAGLDREAHDSECEFRIVVPDGSTRNVVSRRRAVLGRAGEVVGFVGTDLDVTAERAAAAELRAHVQRLDQANAELELARHEADERSRTDALTGLFNRRHFSEALALELARSARSGATPGVLLLDIDRFKAVNDTFGHAVGDVVLAELARRVEAAVRQECVAARWGGEEIAVLVPDLRDDEGLRAVGERIRTAVAATHVTTLGGELSLTISVGGARWSGVAQGADALLDAADRALYAAKRRGRDQTRLATELTAEDLLAEEPEAFRIAQALSLATAVREGMPELHCEQVSELAAAIALELGLPAALVFRARLGGLLHDVGKVAIPDRILAKPGPLDDDEWRVMQGHAAIGEQLVVRLPGIGEAARAVRHHHERWDGRGYPDGLAGEQIPLEARIVAVADAYSAITSDRVYRRGREREEALEELLASAGAHHDAAVVAALGRVLTRDAQSARERLEELRRRRAS